MRIPLAALLLLAPSLALPTSHAASPPPCTFVGTASDSFTVTADRQFSMDQPGGPGGGYVFSMVSGVWNPLTHKFQGRLVILATCYSAVERPFGLTQGEADQVLADASDTYYEELRTRALPDSPLYLVSHDTHGPTGVIYYLNSPTPSKLNVCFLYRPMAKDGILPHEVVRGESTTETWDVLVGTPDPDLGGWTTTVYGGILHYLCTS